MQTRSVHQVSEEKYKKLVGRSDTPLSARPNRSTALGGTRPKEDITDQKLNSVSNFLRYNNIESSNVKNQTEQNQGNNAVKARGMTRSVNGVPDFIALFEQADTSTFCHELYHFYKGMLHAITSGKVQGFVAGEKMSSLLSSLEEYEKNDPTGERGAKAFELYLIKGIAPGNSATMRAFAWIRNQIIMVYRGLKNTYFNGVKLDNQIKQALDSMVMTESEIAEREHHNSLITALQLAEKDGLTTKEQNLIKNLIPESRMQLFNRYDRSIRKIEKQRQKSWVEEFEQMANSHKSIGKVKPVYEYLSKANGKIRYEELVELLMNANPSKIEATALANFHICHVVLACRNRTASTHRGSTAVWRYLRHRPARCLYVSSASNYPRCLADSSRYSDGRTQS